MKYTNNIKSIAIGSFDGMHIAHNILSNKVEALVIIERNGGYLTSGYKRVNFTSKICYFYHFDVIKNLNPEEFIRKLQTDFPCLEKIVVGYDFAFGKDKSGDANSLQKLFCGSVEVVQEVSVYDVSVHSRTIKTYLSDGDINMANRLLGRTYTIDGKVIRGQGIGKKELVPTLNLCIKEYQLPLEGVYATRTKIKDVWLDSVSFIGHRETTDNSFSVESYVIDKDLGNISDDVSLQFVEFIRVNHKFENLEELKKQISIDIQNAKDILCQNDSLK